MLDYILNSSLCLAIFYGFYKIVLEQEKNHDLKRFYLLTILLLSFGIPFITFTTYVEIIPQTFEITSMEFTPIETNSDIIVPIVETNYTPIILWTLYLAGVIILSLQFFYNLISLYFKIKTNEKKHYKNFTHVLLREMIAPHTFFNYIFFHKTTFETNNIPKEVHLHEQAHAQQKHSLDILFIEIIKIAFWFNPLIYFVKHSIKLNHEFLADQAVLNDGITPKTYQQILLSFTTKQTTTPFANAINYSSIKKRFTAMKSPISKKKQWVKSFLILPLVAVLLVAFSQKETVAIEKEVFQKQETIKVIEDDPNFHVFYSKTGELVINSSPVDISNIESEIEKIISKNESNNLKNLRVKVSLMKSIDEDLLDRISSTFRKNGVLKFGVGNFYKTSQQNLDEYKEFSKEFNLKSVNAPYKLKDVQKLKSLYNSLSQNDKNLFGPEKPQNASEIKKQLEQFNSEWEKSYNSNQKDSSKLKELQSQLEGHYKNLTREQIVIFELGALMPIPATNQKQTRSSKKDIQKSSQKNQTASNSNYFRGFDAANLEKKTPTKTQYESWKESDKFAIWLDGKHIANSDLDNYTYKDIVHFWGSFVHKNAKSTKFPQEYQFRLYTETGLEEVTKKETNRTNKNKPFQIEFHYNSNHVQLKSAKGSAWNELGFPMKEGRKVYLDEMGMSDPKNENEGNNGQLANYLISIELKGNEVIFKSLKGTNWKMVSFKSSLKPEQTLIYYINEQGLSIPKIQKVTETIPLAIVEDVPIFPGCTGTTNNELKNCFNKKVLQHLQYNFNTDLLKNSKFKSGNKNMNIKFIVHKNGSITVRSIGPIAKLAIKEDGKVNAIELFGFSKELQNELIRVITTLPKMTPGEQEGEIVTVGYSFQIHFSLDANKIINLSPKMIP